MNEWRRIISDRKRRLAMLCIPLLCLFLFFYQKCDGNFPSLITDAQEYRNLLAICDRKFRAYEAEGCKTYFNKKDHLWTLYEFETGAFKIPSLLATA